VRATGARSAENVSLWTVKTAAGSGRTTASVPSCPISASTIPVDASTRVSDTSCTPLAVTLITEASQAWLSSATSKRSSTFAGSASTVPDGSSLNAAEIGVPLCCAGAATVLSVTGVLPCSEPEGNSTEAPAAVLTVPPEVEMTCVAESTSAAKGSACVCGSQAVSTPAPSRSE
jgi:hypothetical protein